MGLERREEALLAQRQRLGLKRVAEGVTIPPPSSQMADHQDDQVDRTPEMMFLKVEHQGAGESTTLVVAERCVEWVGRGGECGMKPQDSLLFAVSCKDHVRRNNGC